jgi:hypothetical protein
VLPTKKTKEQIIFLFFCQISSENLPKSKFRAPDGNLRHTSPVNERDWIAILGKPAATILSSKIETEACLCITVVRLGEL